jgi:4-hydroxyphenylpyruvate dioxygenase
MGTQALPEAPGTDTFPINGTDYVEFFVGNAKQASLYYRAAFGFQLVGYRGPETGVRDRASYLLVQDKLRFVLTSALGPEGEVSAHVLKHGDGVRDMAFWVDDARDAFAKAVERGATPVHEPKVLADDDGEVVIAAIRTYGDTIHSIVERRNYRGLFLPGFKPVTPTFQPAPTGLKYVDHCVGNVELGKMNEWVGFYERVLGFYNLLSFDDKDISTEYSALMSKVMSNGNGRIKFPINEPAAGKKKSQIEEYLDFYRGPGVQHIAIATDDIIGTVRQLRARGVEFLSIPTSYYDTILDRVGDIDEDLAPLKELGILVDRDDEGYLLQLFTKPQQDRPTLFYEIIQRKGAKSFGKGNFKALFESIEREQALRGNL